MEALALDACDDACSICLEAFSAEDPATVTSCKHEYHLQCILEWSQRSKECPICWQSLVLVDPASQELLAAMEVERSIRTRRRFSDAPAFHHTPTENIEFHNVPPYADELDFDEDIMQHLAASAMGRAHRFSRREMHHTSPGLGQNEFLIFTSSSDESDVQQTHMTSPRVPGRSWGSASPDGDSPLAPTSLTSYEQHLESIEASPISVGSDDTDNRHGPSNLSILASQTPPDSPRRPRQSEFLSFSESLKSRLSAASSKYKETISKSTRGFKEKLLARNSSMKEFSKEIQHEVTAGVARMMERLDPTLKRTGGISPVSGGVEGSSELFHNGESVQRNLFTRSPEECSGKERTAPISSSSKSDHVRGTLSPGPCPMDVAYRQD